MILPVLSERKGTGRFSGQFRRCEPWQEKGDSAGVFLKGCAVATTKFHPFPPHNGRIKQSEVKNKDEARDPGTRGNSCPKGQNGAAKIERISGVSVRSGDGEDLLLVKKAGCIRAQAQSGDTNQGAKQYTSRCGPGKSKNRYRQRIAEAHAPTHEKIASRTHGPASTCRRTASKTVSMSISRMEDAAWSPRL